MSSWWEEYKSLVPITLGALGLGLVFLARNLELNTKKESRYLVKSLVVYPIKSCGAVNLQTAVIGPHGFLLDRHWVVVREDEATFITQRELPQMALIQVSFEYGPGERKADNDNVVALVLNAPGKEPLRIPIGNSDDDEERPQRTISVWKLPLSGKDEGDAAADWLSDYLGRRVRLYGMADDYERNMGWENAEKFIAPTKFEEDGSLSQEQIRSGTVLSASFVDDHPFLLLSTDSVEDVNNHLRAQGKSPIGPERFRANIIVEPAPLPIIKFKRTAVNSSTSYPGYSAQPRGFIEDSWGHITFVPASGAKVTKKSVDLISVGKKTRCRLTTVVPEIGEYPPRLLADGSENPDFNEPLAMLRKYRTFEKFGPSPACGQTFAFHRTSIGNVVTVGSEVLPFTFVDECVATEPSE